MHRCWPTLMTIDWPHDAQLDPTRPTQIAWADRLIIDGLILPRIKTWEQHWSYIWQWSTIQDWNISYYRKINKYIYIYHFRRHPMNRLTQEPLSKFAGGEGWWEEGEAAGQVPLETPGQCIAPQGGAPLRSLPWEPVRPGVGQVQDSLFEIYLGR